MINYSLDMFMRWGQRIYEFLHPYPFVLISKDLFDGGEFENDVQ